MKLPMSERQIQKLQQSKLKGLADKAKRDLWNDHSFGSVIDTLAKEAYNLGYEDGAVRFKKDEFAKGKREI